MIEHVITRCFLQTLKHLRDIQADRKQQEQKELHQMACNHPQLKEKMEPAQFGFVCSIKLGKRSANAASCLAFFRNRNNQRQPDA